MQPNFKPENIEENLQNLITKNLKIIESAAKGSNWDSVVKPLDVMHFELGKYTCVNAHLNAVMFNKDFNAEYEKTLPLIANFYSDMGSNKTLYQAYKNLQNTDLDAQQRHIVKKAIQGFELSGVGLDGAALARFKIIMEKLSVLHNAFAKNSLQATNEWKKTVTKSELKGYGENELAKIKTTKGYQLNLQTPVYMDAMTYLDNRALRAEIYKAYVSRASEVGVTSTTYDNKPIMDEILALRLEMANILGFETYAQLSIKSKMVDSAERVVDFLSDLIMQAKPQARLELQALKDFAKIDLQPWDFSFYGEKLKTHQFGFKKSELTPYFPEQQVLKGLFATVEKLYAVKIKLLTQSSYHQDVKILQISDKAGAVGRIYLDLYARENKRSGAWMADYQGLMDDNKPIAFVVCNLNSPTKNHPALFEFDEIVTLFHEFGHALHHLLTKVKYPSAAGIEGVPWDGVELPSQYMEFFCYQRDVIDLISKHHQTGQSLPGDLYDKLIASKNFQSALALLRQCEFSLWDIQTHTQTKDTYAVLKTIRKTTSLIPNVKESRFLNTFGHIFSGGYAAGYFSYKWAEVLAADAYYYVQSQGGIGSRAANDFRRCILETGGSLDFMQQYLKFRGARPSVSALLEANGIK